MVGLDKTAIERVLEELEQKGYLFPQFRFVKIEGHMQLLGKGGFALVYEMQDVDRPEKRYAVKVIGLERHTVSSEDFRRTVSLQRSLSEQSPYIARIIDSKEILIRFDEVGNVCEVQEDLSLIKEEGIFLQFVLMDKLENILKRDKYKKVSLNREVLKSEAEILLFAKQIGQAIMVAHDNNVLHRDIKLENIFWDEVDQRYKLSDFGLAKYVESGNAETVVYTDGYGAPEIERRLKDNYNATADIYSLGISLYLLLNELRFPGSDGYFVNMVQYAENFIFPAPKNSSVEVTGMIRKMCSYHREDRHQSMQEVLAEINCLLDKGGLEQDEEIELDDIRTETYRENIKLADGYERGAQEGRTARKEWQRYMDKYFAVRNLMFFGAFGVLFVLLCGGFCTDNLQNIHWSLWGLAIALAVESVLMFIRELHIVGGIVAGAIGIYSVLQVGVTVPHIILLFCLCMSIPPMALAGAAGVFAWLVLNMSDFADELRYIYTWDLGWIALILIYVLVLLYVELRLDMADENPAKYGKLSSVTGLLWSFVCHLMPLLMVVTGIIIYLLESVGIWSTPEVLQRLHLIRTGLCALIVQIVMYRKYGYCSYSEMTEEEEPIEDVYLDE